MGQTLKVFLVRSIGYDELVEVCAFFDSELDRAYQNANLNEPESGNLDP